VAILGTTLRWRGEPIIWAFHDVPDLSAFEACVDEIAAGLDVVPLETLARERSRRSCAVTFDDGLRSVVEVAHPVLSARGLPFTVFLCTEVLSGGPVPWFVRAAHAVDSIGLDRVLEQRRLQGRGIDSTWGVITALKERPLDDTLAGLQVLEEEHSLSVPAPGSLFLSSDEVSTLAGQGVTFGSHTHRHPILSRLTAEAQRSEIEESARVIERLTERRPTEFAYPNGTPLDFDERTLEALRASGFTLAVTTVQRRVQRTDDPLRLPRIGIEPSTSHARLALKTLAPRLAPSYRREYRLRRSVLPEEAPSGS
jgi:peptidoglycan/xylan/chitin deacetylase (PgdA/CDA1 family)